jgi:hypothetical protein
MQILQAITTTYYPPTNTQSARVRVKCRAKTKFFPWIDNLDIAENHKYSASKMAALLKWDNGHLMFGGGLPDNSYSWVFVPRATIHQLYDAERAARAELLKTAIEYLNHPDVTKMPFAVKSTSIATALSRCL